MAPRASETHTQVPHITSGAYLLNTSQGNVEKSHTGTAAPTAVLNFPQNQLDCCESPESPAIRRMMFVTLRSEQPRAATDCSKSRWLLPGGLNWGTSGCCSEFCHAVTKQGWLNGNCEIWGGGHKGQGRVKVIQMERWMYSFFLHWERSRSAFKIKCDKQLLIYAFNAFNKATEPTCKGVCSVWTLQCLRNSWWERRKQSVTTLCTISSFCENKKKKKRLRVSSLIWQTQLCILNSPRGVLLTSFCMRRSTARHNAVKQASSN